MKAEPFSEQHIMFSFLNEFSFVTKLENNYQRLYLSINLNSKIKLF